MAERQSVPENLLAVPHMVTRLDVECDPRFAREDIGLWVVIGSGGLTRCINYKQACDLASSFNRCPA
jgi:hypothetical protein